MDTEKKDRDVSSAASAMGKKRWEGISEEERKAEMEKIRSRIDLTPEERTAIGTKAVNARWAKWRAEHPDKAGKAETGTPKPSKSAGRTKKPAEPGSRKRTRPKP